jgi:hypothetical protein
VIGHLWQKVDLSLSEDSYRRVAMDGYPFSALIEVETTPRFVKAIVYDYGSDLVGTTGVAMK